MSGATLAQRKADRAAKARAALALKRAAAEGQHQRPQAWPHCADERVVVALLDRPLLESVAATSRHLGVEEKFFARRATICSIQILNAELEAFSRLLAEVRAAQDAEVIRGQAFTMIRQYDETPTTAWTYAVRKNGNVEGQTNVAKIMASSIGFSMVLEVLNETALDHRQRSPVAAQRHFHIIQGSLGSRLVSMANQSQEVVYETIKSTMLLPDEQRAQVEALFLHKQTLRMTDLHRAGIPAERQLLREQPEWASGLFRCSIHRVRTAEKAVIALDAHVESFFLNYTLSLRQPDAQRTLRDRVRKWVEEKLQILHGVPPPDVMAWRRSMEGLMFGANNCATSRAELARRYCWDALTNGDGRNKDQVQHYCSPSCCPGGPTETLEKLLGPYGVTALLTPAPGVFPRRSWAGQCECMGHVIQQEATHGLLSHNFRPVVQAAQLRAEKALRRLAKTARPQQPHSSCTHADVQEAILDERAAKEAKAASLAEEAAQNCQNVMDFLTRADCLKDMIRLRILLEPMRPLKASILHRSGASWLHRQMAAAADGTAPQRRSNPYPVVIAHKLEEVTLALEEIGERMQSGVGNPWECYEHMRPSSDDSELRWRALSRAGAVLTQLLKQEQGVYPWKLFKLLDQENAEAAAEDISLDAEVCKRIFDPLSLAHWKRYNSPDKLLSPESLAELHSMALVITDSTAAIERGHAHAKRATRARTQTHSARIAACSVHKVLRYAQAQAAAWYSSSSLQSHTATAAGNLATSQVATQLPTQPFAAARRPHRRDARAKKSRRDLPKHTQRRASKVKGSPRRSVVNRAALWMSQHVTGRLITEDDWNAYREVMANDKKTEQLYTLAAKVQTDSRQAGQTQRKVRHRQHDPLHSALRSCRRDAKRAMLPWDHQAARKRLAEERASQFGQELARRKKAMNEAARERRHQQNSDRTTLMKYAQNNCIKKARVLASNSPHVGTSGFIPTNCVPHPFPAVLPDMVSVSSSYWAPDRRSETLARLPAALRRCQEQQMLTWQAKHATLSASEIAKFAPQKPRLCCEAGRCICSFELCPTRDMQVALGKQLTTWMGPGSRKEGITDNRRSVEEGRVIARLLGSNLDNWPAQETRWWHLAFMHFDQIRPTVLRLDVVKEANECDVVLAASRSLGQSHPRWLTSWDAIESLDPETIWSVEWWHITAVDYSFRPCHVHASKVDSDGAPHEFWAGLEDVTKSKQKAKRAAKKRADKRAAKRAAQGAVTKTADGKTHSHANPENGHDDDDDSDDDNHDGDDDDDAAAAAAADDDDDDDHGDDCSRDDADGDGSTNSTQHHKQQPVPAAKLTVPVPTTPRVPSALPVSPALPAPPAPPSQPAPDTTDASSLHQLDPAPRLPAPEERPPTAMDPARLKELAGLLGLTEGQRLSLALRGDNGEVIPVLITARPKSNTWPDGGFQATCHHHKPMERTTKDLQRTYIAPCRKEVRIIAKYGDAEALRRLFVWVCAAPSCNSAIKHETMKVPRAGSTQSRTFFILDNTKTPSAPSAGSGLPSASNTEGHELLLRKPKTPPAPRPKRISAVPSASKATGHDFLDKPKTPPAPALSAERISASKSSDSESDSSSSSTRSSSSSSSSGSKGNTHDHNSGSHPKSLPQSNAAALPPGKTIAAAADVCVCGERHNVKQCRLWRLAATQRLQDVDHQSKAHGPNLIRSMGGLGCGCLLQADEVQTVDVPGDGNCLFHALGLEIQRFYPGTIMPERKDIKAPGPGWRTFMVNYVRKQPDIKIGDFTIRDLIQFTHSCTIPQYCESMANVGSEESWGGFVEAALLCQAWGNNLTIVLLRPHRERRQWQTLAWAGAPGRETQLVCAAWLGNHWVRAVLTPNGHAKVRQWQAC